MKKSKIIAALLCGASLIFGSVVPAMADAARVVTLGNDLTAEQKNTMMRYFQVNQNEVQVLLVTNQDERNHLLGYVPESQIGTRTLSCAYVKPTSSGGIKVRTANLNWVTCNMIASSLSTAGVKNCEVVAACPIEVSGTGALTGVQMAYERATGQQLDPVKKKLAAQEVVVCERYANDVGKKAATNVINKSKINIIQNNITNNNEIYNTVVNIAQQNNYGITQEQAEEITELLQKIADQGYDYEDVKDTLENVDENLEGESEKTESDTEQDAEKAEEDGPSILDEVAPSELGDVIEDSTENPDLADETGNSDEVEMSQEDMDFTFDEDLANETIDEGLSEEDPSQFLEADLNSFQPEPEGELIITDDIPESEFTVIDGPEAGDLPELPEISEEIPGTEVPPATEEQPISQQSETLDASLLSEQARSQFNKMQAFCQGEFEGNSDQLWTAVGDDMYAYNYGTAFIDPETAKSISKAIQTEYYNVLRGTKQYVPNGMESFMSPDLNSMDQFLKQFFGIQTGTPDASLANVSEADRNTLYNDSLRFFKNLYGENFDAQPVANDMPVDAGEPVDYSLDNTGYEGDSYYQSDASYTPGFGTGVALDYLDGYGDYY